MMARMVQNAFTAAPAVWIVGAKVARLLFGGGRLFSVTRLLVGWFGCDAVARRSSCHQAEVVVWAPPSSLPASLREGRRLPRFFRFFRREGHLTPPSLSVRA